MGTGLGRPRATGPSTSGLTTEQDILVAAASLFCDVGYGSTSTHAIARGAGVSQASLYHWFAGKHEILLTLLLETVQPSVRFSADLLTRGETAEARLWALCSYDVQLLVGGTDNTGSLYLLPELGDERFAEFHVQRDRLFEVYRSLVAASGADDPDTLAGVVFGLVESVILRRRAETGPAADPVAPLIADAALRVIGVEPTRLVVARGEGSALLAEMADVLQD